MDHLEINRHQKNMQTYLTIAAAGIWLIGKLLPLFKYANYIWFFPQMIGLSKTGFDFIID